MGSDFRRSTERPPAGVWRELGRVPAHARWIVGALLASNTGDLDAQIDVAITPAERSGPPLEEDLVLRSDELPAGDVARLLGGLILGAGDAVWVRSTTGAINFTLGRQEIAA